MTGRLAVRTMTASVTFLHLGIHSGNEYSEVVRYHRSDKG